MDASTSNQNGQSGGKLQTPAAAPAPTTTINFSSRTAAEDHPLQQSTSSSNSSKNISATSSSTSINSSQSLHSRGNSFCSLPPRSSSSSPSSSSSLSSVERCRDQTATSLTTTTHSFLESSQSETAALEHEDEYSEEAALAAVIETEQQQPARFYHVCPPARGTVPSPSDTDDKIRCLIREMMQPHPRCSICSTTSVASSSAASSTCASNSTSNIVSAAAAMVDVSEVSIAMAGSTPLHSPPLSASADCSVESAASTAVVIDEQDNDDEAERQHREDGYGDSPQQLEMFPLKEGIKWPSHTSILLPETELEKQQREKEEEQEEKELSEPFKVPQPPTQKRASRTSVHLEKVNDYSHRVARYVVYAERKKSTMTFFAIVFSSLVYFIFTCRLN